MSIAIGRTDLRIAGLLEEVSVYRSSECKVGADDTEVEFEVGPDCGDSVDI